MTLEPEMFCDALEDDLDPFSRRPGTCSGISTRFFLVDHQVSHSNKYCEKHGKEYAFKNRHNGQVQEIDRDEYIVYKVMGT